MFTALQTLLATLASLTVSLVSNGDGTLTVAVYPNGKKEGESALNTSLKLTGTAAELDAGFVSSVSSYTSKRSSLAEQLEVTEAIFEAAKKEAATKATKAVSKKGTAPAKSSTTAASDNDGDGNGDGDDGEGHTASTPAAEAKSVDNLFD